MKALILNSGTGSRLKSKEACKCLTRLADDVTILDAQLIPLLRCGVEDICITTGLYADMLENYVRERYACENHLRAHFTFVHNPLYENTNYIYSIHLAREHLQDGDILLLHGDLVFEQNVLQDISAARGSVMAVDTTKPLPSKDFKARVENGRITAIGVDIFENALYAQPLYKLLQEDWSIWLERIDSFCKQGGRGVYAENAFNEISGRANLLPLDITGRMCFEVDTDEDLACARDCYAKMPDRLQTVYSGYGSRRHVKDVFARTGAKKPFVVTGANKKTAQELFGSDAIYFSDYKPNPDIKDAVAGKKLFEKENCDFIVSLGGGSAMDTAKCIVKDSPCIQHLAIPTSAGTGSESTEIAVIYSDNVKQSISDPQIMPDYAILDPDFLKTLPEYHKKCCLLDALCQAIESLWSVKRTPMSISYARAAQRIIWEDAREYLAGDTEDAAGALCSLRILHAANLAGMAINISRTTAPHAMSYKLSTGFGIAHGHAVALCMIPVWEHLLKTGDAQQRLSAAELERFIALFDSMGARQGYCPPDVRDLAAAVNIERLTNHPVALTEQDLIGMYERIMLSEEQFPRYDVSGELPK